jgi:hypothetical protein
MTADEIIVNTVHWIREELMKIQNEVALIELCTPVFSDDQLEEKIYEAKLLIARTDALIECLIHLRSKPTT